MVKKPYSKPVILRIKLNHEQAVLSPCSTQTGSISTNSPPSSFCRTDPPKCRRGPGSGDDSNATS